MILYKLTKVFYWYLPTLIYPKLFLSHIYHSYKSYVKYDYEYWKRDSEKWNLHGSSYSYCWANSCQYVHNHRLFTRFIVALSNSRIKCKRKDNQNKYHRVCRVIYEHIKPNSKKCQYKRYRITSGNTLFSILESEYHHRCSYDSCCYCSPYSWSCSCVILNENRYHIEDDKYYPTQQMRFCLSFKYIWDIEKVPIENHDHGDGSEDFFVVFDVWVRLWLIRK